MHWQAVRPKKKYRQNDDILTKLACIFGVEDLHEFLNPSEGSLYDPYLLSNIQIANKKILNALHAGKKISVFADIDSDGITSCAIIYNYLRQFTENIEYFSAQRSDGHGISSALDKVPHDTELLIIVDSSTSDEKGCKILSEHGLDIVVIDHHPVENDNPYALIVNAQISPEYHNKELSGAGHCLKMIQVLDDTLGSDTWQDFYDLAGVGIHGDQMSMREPENRYIVTKALDNMKNLGLMSILKVAKKTTDNLISNDIGFTIAPFLNGASRMDQIELALECLTTDDMDRALELAKQISKLNDKRKTEQRKFVQKHMEKVNPDDKVICIIDNSIGKGFAGLVANDIATRLQKPVLVLADNGKGEFAGSFRSISGFKLKTMLSNMSEVSFTAGHEGAGGVNVPQNRWDDFSVSVQERYTPETTERVVYYDLELDADEITQGLIEDIMRFTRICGKGCYEAKFKVTNLLALDKKLMGKKNDTIKIETDVLDLMKFRSDEAFFESAPSDYDQVEAVGTLNINKWYNWSKTNRGWVVSNQMFLEDYVTVE